MLEKLKNLGSVALVAVAVASLAGGGYAVAQSSAAVYAGHNTVTCDSDNEAITAPLSDTAGTAAPSRISARDVTIIATSETEVRIFSKNGQAASEGVKLCAGSATGCVGAVELPGPVEHWQCYAASDTDVTVLVAAR